MSEGEHANDHADDMDETQPYSAAALGRPAPDPEPPPAYAPAPRYAPWTPPAAPSPTTPYSQQLPVPAPAYAPVPTYGRPMVPAPYGFDPVTGLPWSDKSRTTAGLLQLLLPLVGVCGVGRLYAGNIAIGLVQLLGFFFGALLVLFLVGILVVPGIWIWTVVDGIVLLAAGGKDGSGRRLR